MTFISYAQNFEDVMLWRALKQVEKGFYIDVGAWSPDIHSVTRSFYERDWRGINVEPHPEFYAQLVERRTRDINLSIAVSDRVGSSLMNFLNDSGLSTLDDAIAERHSSNGWTISRREVDVTTLAALWKQHVPEGQEVHFLKVDAEGSEEAVLRGNDWLRFRPWIVVVEATLPMSQQENYDAWEPMLLTARYNFAYADGLNRFYIAEEHNELLPAFAYPPNLFDDFKLYAQQQAEANAQEAAAEASTALMVESERSKWLEEGRNAAQARIEEQAGELALIRDRSSRLEVQLAERSQELDSTTQTLNKERERAVWLENEWKAARDKIDEINDNANHWRNVADALNHELQAVRSSYCWRATGPLRAAYDVMLRMYAQFKSIPMAAKGGLCSLFSPLLVRLIRFALAHSALREHALAFLRGCPSLETRLRRFAGDKGIIAGYRPMQTHSEDPYVTPNKPSGLTPSARRIHADLVAAMERQRRGGD